MKTWNNFFQVCGLLFLMLLFFSCSWDATLSKFTSDPCPYEEDGTMLDCKKGEDCHYSREAGRCEEGFECVFSEVDKAFACVEKMTCVDQINCNGKCIDHLSDMTYCGAKPGCGKENMGGGG